MNSAQAKVGKSGFSLFELLIVIVIVALLATALLDRLMFYLAQAEKVAMEQTVGNIRSALHLQMAALVARDKVSDIPRLVEQNPMNWLAEKPPNYAGEYFSPQQGDVVSGNWYFDLKDKNLVYLVHNGTNMRVWAGPQKQLRFRVSLLLDVKSTQGLGKRADSTSIEGLILEPLVP